jgi:nucleoside-diphosphate-sugar epimerase
VEEVIHIIKELSGVKKDVLTKNLERPMEIFDLYADITKIKFAYGWELKIGFKEGIARCIKASVASK